MEQKQISLDLLIDYLVNNSSFKNETNTPINTVTEEKFNLKYLEFFNSKNFNKFNDYFKSFIDRVGVYMLDSKNNNISLLSSILFCLDEDFCTMDMSDQEYYLKTINNKIINDTVNHNFKIKNIK